jgi:hypothetical protein
MERIWKFISSLRLTVVLLSFGILLVFVGTVAQADEGLYQAQARYFKHWFVFGLSFFGYHVPIPLPGGYLLGTLLLLNLLTAHIRRFQWSWKKLGIHLTHAGVVLLLVGQLITDIFSEETQLHFAEGESKIYSEFSRSYELIFASDAGDGLEEIVAIPQNMLSVGRELRNERLPFAVRVKEFWPNSEPSFRPPMEKNTPPLTTNGVAQHFDFQRVPNTKAMDQKDIPTALIEIVSASGSLGLWVVSAWAGDAGIVEALRESYGRRMNDERMADAVVSRLIIPQTITAGGKQFTFTLRPKRIYRPYSLTLLKATHTTYPGRPDIPKDFRSRVRLDNPESKEHREVEIYMNTPLRYQGLTFYQYQMSAGEAMLERGRTPSSTLQVVRNPGWLTPYAGCLIVAAGLVIQFLIHLVGFISRRKTA